MPIRVFLVIGMLVLPGVLRSVGLLRLESPDGRPFAIPLVIPVVMFVILSVVRLMVLEMVLAMWVFALAMAPMLERTFLMCMRLMPTRLMAAEVPLRTGLTRPMVGRSLLTVLLSPVTVGCILLTALPMELVSLEMSPCVRWTARVSLIMV